MKRTIRLGIALLAVAGLVVALVLVRNAQSAPAPAPREFSDTAPAENPDRVRLFENTQDEIRAIRVERSDAEPLAIVRTDEGAFRPDYEFDVAFLDSSVNRIVSQSQSLSSRRLIGEVENLAEFGLDTPQATISVERTDGTSQILLIGNQTPAQDAFYVARPNDPLVYTVFGNWIRPYFTELDALRERSIPQVTFETLERIEVATLGGREIVAQRLPDWDEDPEMGFAAYATTAPYDRRYQANNNWFETTGEQLTELAIVRFVDDDPANLAQYGLASPAGRLLIRDAENELAFTVGNETDEGRFAQFAGSPSVVVLAGADPILSVDPYETISAFALIINIDLVDSFVVESGSLEYTGTITRTEVEGEEDPEERYFLNDREVDEDLFKDLYQWIIGLQFDAEIPGAASGPVPTSGEALVTITYRMNGGLGTRSVSFIPFNDTFVSVVREGQSEFIMARQKVARMLNAFAEAAD